MTKILNLLSIIGIATGISACAGVMDKVNEMGLGKSSTESIARETARSIGGGILPEQITISNIDRGMSTVKWKATTAKGEYGCSADDMMRSTYCAKR